MPKCSSGEWVASCRGWGIERLTLGSPRKWGDVPAADAGGDARLGCSLQPTELGADHVETWCCHSGRVSGSCRLIYGCPWLQAVRSSHLDLCGERCSCWSQQEGNSFTGPLGFHNGRRRACWFCRGEAIQGGGSGSQERVQFASQKRQTSRRKCQNQG